LQDADAADVRQEVFLSVARKIDDFRRDRAGDTFRGWLHRITQNKLHDHERKRRAGPAAGGARSQEQLRQQPAAPPEDGTGFRFVLWKNVGTRVARLSVYQGPTI
jgi:RNA polymerase sigma-70 factor (ECF subfamily)